jgi:hypothetical protein
MLYAMNGEVGAFSEIIIEGRSFMTRKNLWNALRQLRTDQLGQIQSSRKGMLNSRFHQDPIWIDAICIYLDQPRAKHRRKMRLQPQFREAFNPPKFKTTVNHFCDTKRLGRLRIGLFGGRNDAISNKIADYYLLSSP